MSTPWTITGIRAERRGPDFEGAAWAAYIVSFDGPRGRLDVGLPVEALLGYFIAQRWIAVRLGCIYRHAHCEGREDHVANEHWRNFTAYLLEESEAGAAAAAIAQSDANDLKNLN